MDQSSMVTDEMQAFFGIILDTVNDAVTVVNTDGIVMYWNRTAEEIYGIRRSDIIGRKVGEFFPQGSVMLYQVMETGVPVYKVYHRPRADKHVFINAVPVFDAERQLIGAVAIEQDITSVVKLSEGRYNRVPTVAEPNLLPPLKEGSLTVAQMVDLASNRATDRPVYPFLVVGEAGVGRHTLAELIHTLSGRSGSFVAVPCHQIPSGLLDLELFGHNGDMLGGNMEIRPSRFEDAADGTLYLMNIHTLPLSTQSKLAKALARGEFTRVGGTQTIRFSCQVIASSPPTIESLVDQSVVLPELYYHFHAATILPLRDRKEDLPGLSRYFLEQAASRNGRTAPRLSQEVLAILGAYEWPGNILQLRNVMEHLVMVAKTDGATIEDLPPALRPSTLSDFGPAVLPLNALSEEVERSTIIDALRRAQGNKANAARLLGISRGSLYYKIQQYGINP